MPVEYTYEQLARLSNARLEELFKQGSTPDIKKLLGYESVIFRLFFPNSLLIPV